MLNRHSERQLIRWAR